MTESPRLLGSVGGVLRAEGLLLEAVGPEDVTVQGVSQDSRTVRAGDLFLAWKGSERDAHDFVEEAARRGAVAAIVERRLDVAIPQLVVSDGRRAGALAAQSVLGDPSRALRAVGVTGTNGKTTTAVLVRHLITPDLPAAAIGTLGVLDDGGVWEGTEGLTTPGPVQLASWLRELADRGLRAVVMEASSHALEQHRLDGVHLDAAVFTNLTQDHLDYHRDFEGYLAAKARLVELVDSGGWVIVNRSDRAWDRLDAAGRRLRT